MILADPPWRFRTWSKKGRSRCPDGRSLVQVRENAPERHYPTMPLAQIKAMPVREVAARDCVLLMWMYDPMLPQALEVISAWGFTYKTTGFVWVKERRATSRRAKDMVDPDDKRFPMSTGYWTRCNPEICLLATRGSPPRADAGVRKLIISPRREHSRKPDEQYPRIERLCGDVPRLELFGRQQRPGWDVWGNQTDRFALAA